jgi:hypothetical protein
MMSTCANCGAPTDMCITDILTKEEFASVGNKEILVGVCGSDECKAIVLSSVIEE